MQHRMIKPRAGLHTAPLASLAHSFDSDNFYELPDWGDVVPNNEGGTSHAAKQQQAPTDVGDNGSEHSRYSTRSHSLGSLADLLAEVQGIVASAAQPEDLRRSVDVVNDAHANSYLAPPPSQRPEEHFSVAKGSLASISTISKHQTDSSNSHDGFVAAVPTAAHSLRAEENAHSHQTFSRSVRAVSVPRSAAAAEDATQHIEDAIQVAAMQTVVSSGAKLQHAMTTLRSVADRAQVLLETVDAAAEFASTSRVQSRTQVESNHWSTPHISAEGSKATTVLQPAQTLPSFSRARDVNTSFYASFPSYDYRKSDETAPLQRLAERVSRVGSRSSSHSHANLSQSNSSDSSFISFQPPKDPMLPVQVSFADSSVCSSVSSPLFIAPFEAAAQQVNEARRNVLRALSKHGSIMPQHAEVVMPRETANTVSVAVQAAVSPRKRDIHLFDGDTATSPRQQVPQSKVPQISEGENLSSPPPPPTSTISLPQRFDVSMAVRDLDAARRRVDKALGKR